MAADLDALSRLANALAAHDVTAAATCLQPDAVLTVAHPTQDLVAGGREACTTCLSALFNAFAELSYTPHRRYVAAGEIVEEATLTGRHVDDFLGFAATELQVTIDLRIMATTTGAAPLSRLAVSADLPSLWQQLGRASSAGETNALVAELRQQGDRELRVIRAAVPAPAAAPQRPHAEWWRRRALLLPAGLAAAAIVGTSVLLSGSNGKQRASQDARPASSAAASSPSATPRSSGASRVPVIATRAPSVRPTVQPGRQLVLSADVLFAFDSATLTAQARNRLQRLADQIRAASVQGVIQVNGYTDAVGSTSYDLQLSRDRALAVARVLAPALDGVPVTLVPQGFGEADPVASNATEAGRTRNRRVTIVLPVPR